MEWEKLGQIFCADNNSSKMVTGGRAPVPRHLGDDLFEIYFASYDGNMRGRIYRLKIDINDPATVIELETDPLIDLGNIGFYDDNGIIPSCMMEHDNKLYLYTIGFSLKNKIVRIEKFIRSNSNNVFNTYKIIMTKPY